MSGPPVSLDRRSLSGRFRLPLLGLGAALVLLAAGTAKAASNPGPPAASPPTNTTGAETTPAKGHPVQSGKITLDPATRSASFPARINLAHGPLEVIIATPQGRLHEALLMADISPLRLQALLYALKFSNGPRLPDETNRRGDLLDIDLSYVGPDGKRIREPVEAWIESTRTGAPMKRIGWVFTGSVMREGRFLAEEEGNICLNFSAGATILDSPDPQSTDDTLHVVHTQKAGPMLGLEVTVILSPHGTPPPTVETPRDNPP